MAKEVDGFHHRLKMRNCEPFMQVRTDFADELMGCDVVEVDLARSGTY